jgi:hypothetical protein
MRVPASNSASNLAAPSAAAECCQVAARTLLATRRGAHVVPKYLLGRPTDHLTMMRLGTRAPLALQRWAVALLVWAAQGKVTRYGPPEPDHPMLRAHPTVSDSLLAKVSAGDIVV